MAGSGTNRVGATEQITNSIEPFRFAILNVFVSHIAPHVWKYVLQVIRFAGNAIEPRKELALQT